AAPDRTDPAETHRCPGSSRGAQPAQDRDAARAPAWSASRLSRYAADRDLPSGVPVTQPSRKAQGMGGSVSRGARDAIAVSAAAKLFHPQLRPMREADLPQVLTVEHASYEFPWTLG